MMKVFPPGYAAFPNEEEKVRKGRPQTLHNPIIQRLTVTAGVLSSKVEIIKLTPKSLVRLITHLLRAVALGVGSLRLTSRALELGQLPTDKWVRLLCHWLRVGFPKQTLTPVAFRSGY